MGKTAKDSYKIEAGARRKALVNEGYYDGRFVNRRFSDSKSYNRARIKFNSDPRIGEWEEQLEEWEN
jgi:hypothetical protein